VKLQRSNEASIATDFDFFSQALQVVFLDVDPKTHGDLALQALGTLVAASQERELQLHFYIARDIEYVPSADGYHAGMRFRG
jgi:hypothetical protein